MPMHIRKQYAVCSTACVFVPQIVVDLQSRLTALLVRMTAVEALLGQEPLLTGRYTAAPYRYISQVQTTEGTHCKWRFTCRAFKIPRGSGDLM